MNRMTPTYLTLRTGYFVLVQELTRSQITKIAYLKSNRSPALTRKLEKIEEHSNWN